ncbi:MAG: DUF2723 domain-containing protein, partial [Bacteroidota bacterium]
YKKLNTIIGWIVFIIATTVYFLTVEPTVSFWDCGEYIATAYKLEVGHPPGGPFFQMLGRLFTMFTPAEEAARMINILSALCSSFTILFLFWTITALSKLIVIKSGELEMTKDRAFAILGSGFVGAIAYTFTDSFWFSAVEGEVYSMSSLFTAVVFWAIFKWESISDEDRADKWIIFIAYLMGMSIGVHLLNLLAIPAIAFVYYFKKHKVTRKGVIITGILSFLILFGIQYGIVQYFVWIAAYFELGFVNGFGLPFGSGVIIFAILIIGGIIWGLKWSRQNNHPVLNTAILCFTMILLGYSSYAQIIIRSTANPPMDENNPENVFAFVSYLSREQYGDRPLVYGQYFNAKLDPAEPYKDGTPVWVPDKEKGKYIKADDRKNSIPNYDPKYSSIFPRMYSEKSNHIRAYKKFGNIQDNDIKNERPTFGQNLRFFFTYQIGWMYLRYFMWNFAGRQNDLQGHGNITDGNWICGIPFIDSMRLGSQDELPKSMTRNMARNKFYLLPLILGLIGLFYHFNNDKRGFFVVFILFILTGVGIIVFLNQYPYQPRERDYAYAASFYAFSIWIGIGVLALFDALKKNLPAIISAGLATLICLVVPGVLAKDGWDDHDRSKRYTARDFAANYLNSCAPNAIIFTNGDNDTFPLWYAQEVEGIRTDVRVMNLSLSNTDWYIDQMSRKAYDSDRLPFSMGHEKYRQGTRDYVPFYDRKIPGYTSIREVIDFIASENIQTKIRTQSGKNIDYFPTKKLRIPVDSATVVGNGTVLKELAGKILPAIEWEIKGNYVLKNSLMQLDLLATNKWERPVYFAITVGSDSYMQLENFFQLEGLAYRLVPINTVNRDGQTGRVATDIMYDNMMNKFKWGGMDKNEIYLDETNMRMTYNLRNNFARLADALLKEGKKDSAIKVLDKCLEVMPDKNVPFNFFVTPIAEAYYRAGVPEKANPIVGQLTDVYEDEMNYYLSVRGEHAKALETEKQRAMYTMQRLHAIAKAYKQKELAENIDERIKKLQEDYVQAAPPQLTP